MNALIFFFLKKLEILFYWTGDGRTHLLRCKTFTIMTWVYNTNLSVSRSPLYDLLCPSLILQAEQIPCRCYNAFNRHIASLTLAHLGLKGKSVFGGKLI